MRIASNDVWPVRGVGRGPLGKGHRAGEERAVGRGLRELGARGARSQAARASRCWNKGRPATAAFDGPGHLLPGLLIRMQIQLWFPFL